MSKLTFKERLNAFIAKIKEAKSTFNPMVAKRLKSEIEAEIEPLGLEFVGMVETLEKENSELKAQVNDLQHQLNHLDRRLSQLEV